MAARYNTIGRTDGAAGDGEYLLSLRVRNNLLLRALARAGFANVAEFSRATGISQVAVGAFINMSRPACNKHGVWFPDVLRIADALGEIPDDLFTPAQREARVKRETHFSVDEATAIAMAEGAARPDAVLEAKESAKVMADMIDSLPSQMQKSVLRLRFGIGCDEHTLDEAGAVLGVTRERIRQVEAKALTNLRAPLRADKLVPLLNDGAREHEEKFRAIFK